jgi:predicted O-methyltransferase YrrM
MSHLEQLDQQDRVDGTPREKRLRQIPPETGKFIALLAACAPEGNYIEIGTSAGYSTLWLALACRETGRKIITFEFDQEKVKLAKETFTQAEVTDVVELIEGDAPDYLNDYKDISFCFIDAEKQLYRELYELVVPRMVTGGLLIADNLISHADDLTDFQKYALIDTRVDALVVPIGKGELVCRKI